jgi:cell division protein FtsN
VVKDLKGYWDKAEKRPKSTGWAILVISHMAIFVVGLTLGQWMGDRFARVSSPQKTVVEKAESDTEKVSKSGVDEGRQEPQVAVKQDKAGKTAEGTLNQSEGEPEFTFYESLRKEKTPGVEIQKKSMENQRTDSSKGPGLVSQPKRNRSQEKLRSSVSRVYYVQVSSFREEERARDLAERLKERGYPAEVISKVIIDKGIWHRVRIGPFGNQKEANEKAVAVKKSEKVKPFVTAEKRGE